MTHFESLQKNIDNLTTQAEHGDGELLRYVLSELSFQERIEILKEMQEKNAFRRSVKQPVPKLEFMEHEAHNDGSQLVELKVNGQIEYQSLNRPADRETDSFGWNRH